MDFDFEVTFQNGLKIRAICDDLGYPAEYSYVLVALHVGGAERYRNPGFDTENAYRSMQPESQAALRDSRIKEDDELKEKMSRVLVGGEFRKADNYLLETEGVDNFFSGQIDNMHRLYVDAEYRERMISLYEKEVKPRMPKYNERKIQKAFEKARRCDAEMKEKSDKLLKDLDIKGPAD